MPLSPIDRSFALKLNSRWVCIRVGSLQNTIGCMSSRNGRMVRSRTRRWQRSDHRCKVCFKLWVQTKNSQCAKFASAEIRRRAWPRSDGARQARWNESGHVLLPRVLLVASPCLCYSQTETARSLCHSWHRSRGINGYVIELIGWMVSNLN